MTAKYSYLARTVIDGIYHTGSQQRARRDRLRSLACLRYCANHGFQPVGKRVLDLGGASGRLKPQASEVRSLRYGDGHLVCVRSISTPCAAVPDAAAYRRTRREMWSPAAFLHYSKALCQRVGQRVLGVD